MGNVYRYTECDACEKVSDADFTFIVHGSRALTELSRLRKSGFSVGKIASHFCGYCGGYVPLKDEGCRCGHFDDQGWNYEDDDPRHWK